MKAKFSKWWGILIPSIALATALSFADTTQHPPLRGYGPVSTNNGAILYSGPHVLVGTNTTPRQKNVPIEAPLTPKQLIMGISMKAPPSLPTNNLARLRWIDGDVYALDWEEGDTILIPFKPILKQSKSGKWMLIYPEQP